MSWKGTVSPAFAGVPSLEMDRRRAELTPLLAAALDKLPPRLWWIIERRMKGATMERIGAELAISKQRVKVLERDALNELRVHLNQMGIRSVAEVL
jgi:RNA polymerase sigma factor (sigma-70 family)